ncbi:MAG: hypothetical protein HKN47_03430 [Pirellulaceae bacterium]|nr:hypothetical protein [Pirellulaceae bacterium]
MEPFDTIERIRALDVFTDSDVQQVRKLTDEHPDVAELWDFLGDVIQLSHAGDMPTAESMICYQRAIQCDPSYYVAHESLAFYHDLFDEFDVALRHFRLALEHGAGDTARIGAARILEQLGRSDEAQQELNGCVDQQSAPIIELRREIADGLWAPDIVDDNDDDDAT